MPSARRLLLQPTTLRENASFGTQRGGLFSAGPADSSDPSVGACGVAQLPDRSNVPKPADGKKTVAYYANYAHYHKGESQWTSLFQPTALPYDKITNLNYGFAFINNGSDYFSSAAYKKADVASKTGECVTSDPYGDLSKEFLVSGYKPYQGAFKVVNEFGKSVNSDLKTSLVIGGYEQTVGISNDDEPKRGPVPWDLVTKDEAAMDAFVESCVNMANAYGFDGITLDWEFPEAKDTGDFGALLAKFRSKLGEAPLTVAGPQGPKQIGHFGIPDVLKSVDSIEIMAYDFYGRFWPAEGDGVRVTNMNAPLTQDAKAPDYVKGYSVSEAIDNYFAAGADPSDLVLGLAYYGRTYTGVPAGASGDGLYQPFTGPESPDSVGAVPDYRAIVPFLKDNSWAMTWVDTDKVPVLYNKASQTFISYDDPKSISAKVSYAKDKGFGGSMIWTISGDTPQLDLLTATNESG